MNDIVSLARAYDRAALWHAGQRRKGNAAAPYLDHLTEVARLVAEGTGGKDVDLLVAAVLHDAVEHAGIDPQQIAAEFGIAVRDLVLELTDDKSLSEEERKRLQIKETPHKSDRAKLLKIADKTSNLQAIIHASPPWTTQRKREYLTWAREVVAGARGINPWLEAQFDNAAAELEDSIR